MLDRHSSEFAKDRPKSGKISYLEEILRLQPYIGQHRLRDITTALLEVVRDIV